MLTIGTDPLFDPTAVQARVQNLWMQLQLCRAGRDMEPLKPYFSDELYLSELSDLRRDAEAGRCRCAGHPAVLSSSLSRAAAEQGRETLLCSLFTRFTPQVLEWGTQRLLSVQKETFYREVWTLSRPGGTLTPRPGQVFSVHCSGCGAPLSLYKSAKCPMCGSLAAVPEFTWTIESITVREERDP